jgi:hypothetical protein
VSGYTKLFASIITSTIWGEPKDTKILWITMLAAANKDGVVEGSVPGLACIARLSTEETAKALLALESPDAFSRTKTHEGRRIQTIEGGWQLLNHSKYRALMSAEDRREYLRKKQAEHRAKEPVKKRQQMSTVVSAPSTPSTHSEADTKAGNTLPAKPAVKMPIKPRQPNPCFDALVDFEGIAAAEIGAAGGRIARQLQIIKESTPAVTPEEIAKRGRAYCRQWPGIVPTAAGLAKHWPALGTNGHDCAGPTPIPAPAMWRNRMQDEFPDSRQVRDGIINLDWAKIPREEQKTISEVLK